MKTQRRENFKGERRRENLMEDKVKERKWKRMKIKGNGNEKEKKTTKKK